MGWFEAAQGNNTRIAVTAKRFAEEGFGGGDVARATLAHLSQLEGSGTREAAPEVHGRQKVCTTGAMF
jgi:hypothetical protein